MNRIGHLLGVHPVSWEQSDSDRLTGAVLIAVGGWAIMAWNRLGVLAFTTPRSGVRFVLIGFYAYLGMALAVAAVARLVDPKPVSIAQLRRTVQVIGLAHRPLLVIGLVVQISALIAPLTSLAPIAAWLSFGLWMPAMLVGAVRWVRGISSGQALLIVSVPYLLWLLTAGRFLLDRVGHLV